MCPGPLCAFPPAGSVETVSDPPLSMTDRGADAKGELKIIQQAFPLQPAFVSHLTSLPKLPFKWYESPLPPSLLVSFVESPPSPLCTGLLWGVSGSRPLTTPSRPFVRVCDFWCATLRVRVHVCACVWVCMRVRACVCVHHVCACV